MPETFTILDDGETLITGEWIPSPEDVAARMLALASYYDNMMPPLLLARQEAINSTESNFDSQSDPQGNPWAALDPDYLAQKQKDGFGDEILVRTGEGKKAATSTEAWFISEDALWFNPQVLPEYMTYHQAGTSSLGDEARGVLSKLRRGESITSQEAGMVIEGGTGKGQNLPKREFVGISDIDILVFEDIFNTWFAEGIVEEFPTSGGAGISFTGQTGFNILGEFPIIGRTKRGQPILRTPHGVRFGRL